MQKRPIIYIVIAFLLGHVAASSNETLLWFYILAVMVMFILLLTLLKACTWKLAFILLLLFAAGSAERYLVDSKNVTKVAAINDQDIIEVTGWGTIVSEVDIDGNVVKFVFRSDRLQLLAENEPNEIKEKFMVHLSLQDESQQRLAARWHRGLKIMLAGELSAPATASNKGAFNYRQYLHQKKIHWLWKGEAGELDIISKQWSTSAMIHIVDDLRILLASPLDGLFSATESGYLKGLILGIRSDLDPEQFRSFSTLGLTHILAISGLHVAVFMYIVTALLKLMRRSKEQIIIALLILIPCYVALTGASPSVLRAGMMAMIALFAAYKGQLKDGLHIISVVAAILILWDPYLLHNVSFQLSFIVTLGLIVGVPAIQNVLPSNKRWKWAIDLLSVTIVAQIISFPLTIYYFNQFHLLSLLANFFLVPFISMIVMPLASLVLAIGHISTDLAKPIANIVHWCNEATFDIVNILGSVQSLHSIWATPSIVWLVVWYLVWFNIFMWWRRKPHSNEAAAGSSDETTKPIDAIIELELIYPVQKQEWIVRNVKQLFSITVIVIILFIAYFPNLFDRNAQVSFLDIGQGDASLIRTPAGKVILIDGGGTISFGQQEEWKKRRDPFEVGKKVLLPLLMKRGVHEIDLLIITHLDTDHIGGLIEIIKTIPVKEIWWNGTYTASAQAEQLFELIVGKQIALKTPVIGDSIEVDTDTTIDVLWPLEEISSHIKHVEKQNEHSLVFLLTIYQSTFLYTGDIGSDTESKIVELLIERDAQNLMDLAPTISVMKAAHHGSRYSTDYAWLSYFEPQATVISAGRNNSYGHPHPDVLGRLAQYNSLVWRTDLDGEILFKVTRTRLFYQYWK